MNTSKRYWQYVFEQRVEREKSSLQKWHNYSLNQDVLSAVCVYIIRLHQPVLSHGYSSAAFILGVSDTETPPPTTVHSSHG